MQQEILPDQKPEEFISDLLKAFSVNILYACESGSRAWGFASPNSDYDVRYIYTQSPEFYISAFDKADHQDWMSRDKDFDVCGWDLKKALGLLYKSNPPLMEWLRSPIIYTEFGPFMEEFSELAERCFQKLTCMYHYLHMAQGNSKDELYLGTDKEQVRLKKYFYVLRPILACRWLEINGTFPPIEFDKLLDASLHSGTLVYQQIQELLTEKKNGAELGIGKRKFILDDFIQKETVRLKQVIGNKQKPHGVMKYELDEFLFKWVNR